MQYPNGEEFPATDKARLAITLYLKSIAVDYMCETCERVGRTFGEVKHCPHCGSGRICADPVYPELWRSKAQMDWVLAKTLENIVWEKQDNG